jgi:hypothetical protein
MWLLLGWFVASLSFGVFKASCYYLYHCNIPFGISSPFPAALPLLPGFLLWGFHAPVPPAVRPYFRTAK